MKKTLALILTLVMLIGTCAIAIPVSATTTPAAWDGTTISTSLSGSGTQADPYLIQSPADFLYITKTINDKSHAAGVFEKIFEDKYFEQTCDIDFGGKDVPAMAYYCNADADIGVVFAGNYDGGNFTIKNANITKRPDSGKGMNRMGQALFGIIYGATIKNIVCDNITVIEHSGTGGEAVAVIVGKAAAPANAPADFNLIENCTVKDTCTIKGTRNDAYTLPYGQSGQTFVGGIAGVVRSTTIKNCVNEADLYNEGGTMMSIGGIVSVIANTSVVENCTNKGNIILNVTGSWNWSRFDSNLYHHVNGGIVGFVTSKAYAIDNNNSQFLQLSDPTVHASGDLTIKNCTNEGSITTSIKNNNVPSVVFGGILGMAKDMTHSVKILNCENKAVTADISSISPKSTVGCIVGVENSDYTDSLNPKTTVKVTISDCTNGTITLVHSEKTIEGIPATENSAGLTDGKECSVCGDMLLAQEVIPATGGSGNNNGNADNNTNNNNGNTNGSNETTDTAKADDTTAKADDTTAKADTTDLTVSEDEGCGSVIGGGAVAIIAVLGGAVAIKSKKKED